MLCASRFADDKGHHYLLESVKRLKEISDVPFTLVLAGDGPLLEERKAQAKELGLDAESYGFYLDLRKYGSARHAGFGLGFERMIMYLTGMGNIRDVLPFPRTVGNCEL